MAFSCPNDAYVCLYFPDLQPFWNQACLRFPVDVGVDVGNDHVRDVRVRRDVRVGLDVRAGFDHDGYAFDDDAQNRRVYPLLRLISDARSANKSI